MAHLDEFSPEDDAFILSEIDKVSGPTMDLTTVLAMVVVDLSHRSGKQFRLQDLVARYTFLHARREEEAAATSSEYAGTVRGAENRVFRVWIALNPNDDENENFPEHVSTRTKCNFDPATIVRAVKDQLEATDEVFRTMLATNTGFGLRSMSAGEVTRQKMYHTVSCLRLNGIEVIEYFAKGDYDQVEVRYEQDPEIIGQPRFTCALRRIP